MGNATCKYCKNNETDKETEFCSSRCRELWHQKGSKLGLEQDNSERDGSSGHGIPPDATGKFGIKIFFDCT